MAWSQGGHWQQGKPSGLPLLLLPLESAQPDRPPAQPVDGYSLPTDGTEGAADTGADLGPGSSSVRARPCAELSSVVRCCVCLRLYIDLQPNIANEVKEAAGNRQPQKWIALQNEQSYIVPAVSSQFVEENPSFTIHFKTDSIHIAVIEICYCSSYE